MNTADERAEMIGCWPRLGSCDFTITSKKDGEYNCLSWAVGIDDLWIGPEYSCWWPNGMGRDHGPPFAIPVEMMRRVYAIAGFEDCENGALEDGMEKVAIYARGSNRTLHAAVQLEDGRWSSKMGGRQDIAHATLEAVIGGTGEFDYGLVVAFMKRPRSCQTEHRQRLREALGQIGFGWTA